MFDILVEAFSKIIHIIKCDDAFKNDITSRFVVKRLLLKQWLYVTLAVNSKSFEFTMMVMAWNANWSTHAVQCWTYRMSEYLSQNLTKSVVNAFYCFYWNNWNIKGWFGMRPSQNNESWPEFSSVSLWLDIRFVLTILKIVQEMMQNWVPNH